VANDLLAKLTGKKKHTSYGTITHEPIPPTHKSLAEIPVTQPKLSDLFTRRLIGVFVNHTLLSMLDHAYIALLAIYLATPITSGGLGLDASQIGLIIGVTGLAHGLLQTVCFTPLYKTFDPKKLYTFCMAVTIPWYAFFPCVNAMVRTHGISYPGVWILLTVQLALLLPSYTSFSASLCVFYARTLGRRG
jgi:hypothetical protein